MRIAMIGLGIMGKPMAKNLLKAGYDVWVNNRSRAPVDELAACGAHPATRQEIGENCDIVFTMLPNGPQAKEVMGSSVVLCGDVGAGNTTKLANQIVVACNIQALAEALTLAMGHLGWMIAPEKKFISKYLINIAIPCNCITGLLNNLDRERLVEAGGMILAAAVEISEMIVLAVVAALVLRLPRDRWGVFVVMSGRSDTSYVTGTVLSVDSVSTN